MVQVVEIFLRQVLLVEILFSQLLLQQAEVQAAEVIMLAQVAQVVVLDIFTQDHQQVVLEIHLLQVHHKEILVAVAHTLMVAVVVVEVQALLELQQVVALQVMVEMEQLHQLLVHQ